MSTSQAVDLFIQSQWYKYLLTQIGALILLGVFLQFQTHLTEGDFSLVGFLFESWMVLVAATFLFALVEKSKKELFVVRFANEKSCKQLLTIINSATSIVAIVSRNGQFLFYNEQFETLALKKLNHQSVPENLLSLTKGSQSNSTKLQKFLKDFYEPDEKRDK